MATEKTITRQQVAGSQGEAFVRERANAMGLLYSPYGTPEAGIDGLIEIRDPASGVVSGQIVAVQVKTTDDGGYTAETGTSFEYLMDQRDVEYWRGSNVPVILVVVRLNSREAYWKDTSTGTGSGDRRLCFSKTDDLFNETARDKIAALCVSKGQWGVWFPAMKAVESCHLNLVEVTLPESIFIAPSPFKTGRQALGEHFSRSDERLPDDWVLRNGQFMSFRNPEGTALEPLIDSGALEEFAAEDMAFPNDEADERAMIELLRRTLSAQLDGMLTFDRKRKVYYFPAVPEVIEQTYQYVSLKVKTSADVVKRYEKDGRTQYVRHHAFEPRFWRLEDRWFLSIAPTFVFTWDGFRPDKFEASRLAGKKKLEANASVLGQFVMWRHLLVEMGKTAAKVDLFSASDAPDVPLLTFLPVDSLGFDRGVPDDLWRSSDPQPPEESGQGRLAV